MKFPKRGTGIKDKLYAYISKLLSQDSIVMIEVTGKRRKRTNDQNAWLWGCIYPMFLQAAINEGWEFTGCEQVHEFCKNMFTKDSVVNRETGEIVIFPRSTSVMTTLEFFTYCDLIRQYTLEYFYLEIPEPDPEWRTGKQQIDIDNNDI
jgi:hypothetical protein